ncbi:MAG: hypothetical protein AAGA77_05380 [Bacteroidota bacterium]
MLSFTVIPIQENVKNLFDVSFGLVFSSLLHESFSGEERNWAGPDRLSEDLSEKYRSFSRSFIFGMKCIISKDIKISNDLALCPHYAFGIGLINEFKNFPRSTKSTRHFWGIGLKKRLNP